VPRKRNKENDGLPKRWRRTRGAYYYEVRAAERPYFDNKQTFRLGKALSAAHAEYSKRLQSMTPEGDDGGEQLRTVEQLLDKYALEVTPTKAERTQLDEPRYVVNLKKFFAGPPPALIVQVKARHAYQYFNWRVKRGAGKGKRAARLEIALLSHAFTHALRWGVPGLDEHPFIDNVRFEGEENSQARDRYVEDWEIEEALKLKPLRKRGSVRMIQAYIRIKELTGLRRADMLRLRPGDFTDEGIFVKARKTAKTTGHKKTIEWSDELQGAVEAAKRARPVDISPWLFCDKDGQCYAGEDGLASGFDSMWQRFMDRLLKETKIKERFQEKDIRGKTGSDSESDQEAAKRLGHADVAVTRKHYRRKGEKVKPLR
jgi:integrase